MFYASPTAASALRQQRSRRQSKASSLRRAQSVFGARSIYAYIMIPTSLIVVADRGEVKAYRVNDTPNRGASLQLVQALDITDAHGRYDEKLTDQAGRFPVSDGNGRHANSISERTDLENENERRICKQLAEQN